MLKCNSLLSWFPGWFSTLGPQAFQRPWLIGQTPGLGVRSDFQSCLYEATWYGTRHQAARGLVPAPKSRNPVPQPSETQLPCFKYGVLHKTWTQVINYLIKYLSNEWMNEQMSASQGSGTIFLKTLKEQSKAKFSNQKLETLIYCHRTSWKILVRDTWTF